MRKPIIQSVLLPHPSLASKSLASKKKALEEALGRLDTLQCMLEVESSEYQPMVYES